MSALALTALRLAFGGALLLLLLALVHALRRLGDG